MLLPDKNGKIDDCVLGFDKAAEYDRHRDSTNCFGATIGRVANRIRGANFTIDAQKTTLAVNCGDEHHLHGGDTGWHRKDWESKEILNGVEFTYVSEDGDDKYPGKVINHVRYTLIENNLHVSFESRLAEGETKSSPINLTNHSYFNLAGHANESGVL